MKDIEIDLQQAQRFLRALLPDPEEKVIFQTFLDEKRESYEARSGQQTYVKLTRECTRVFCGTLRDHVKELNQLQRKGAGVFVAINTIEGEVRKKSTVSGIRSWFTDRDNGRIQNYHIEPSIIVDTPQGEHTYFINSGDASISDFSKIQKKLIRHYSSDPAVHGAERVMRLPGSFHLKDPKNPIKITIRSMSGKKYSSKEILEGLKAEDKEPNKSRKVESADDPKNGQEFCQGQRHTSLLKHIGSLRAKSVPIEAAKVALKSINDNFCDPPLPDQEVTELADSVYKYEDSVVHYNFSDAGRAEGFINYFLGKLHFIPEHKKWVKFNGRIWEPCSEEGLHLLCKEFALYRRSLVEASTDIPIELMKLLKSDLIKLESAASIKNYLLLAKSLVCKSLTEFDQKHSMVSVKNGVVDLKTGKLVKHQRSFYFTKELNINFDSRSSREVFDGFIESIFLKNLKIIEYIKRACGYSVTGENKEQALFLLYGSGANGKSTFLDAIRFVFSKYVKNAEIKTFQPIKSEKIRNDLARLADARLVTSIETNEGARLDEALIKSITGGDPVTARFLHREYFEYVPRFKLWIAVNHKPHISGVDKWIWRRMRVIPFNAQFEGASADKDLLKKLKLEAEGIFAWLVEGAVDWYKSGLSTPDQVIDATERYKDDEDYFAYFLEDRCKFEDSGFTLAGELKSSYSEWRRDNGCPELSFKTLKSRLLKVGIESARSKTHGLRGYKGICLKSHEDRGRANY